MFLNVVSISLDYGNQYLLRMVFDCEKTAVTDNYAFILPLMYE